MRVVYDLTIYEADGVTPMFGSAYEGVLEESDFQTPDPELEHPRPYLSMPFNGIGTEINFIEGSSVIGSQQVKILDKRTDPADQSTGIVTARVPDMVGMRAVWRRYVDGAWRVRLEGVIVLVTVDPDDLVAYVIEINDGRRFEKDQNLFFSNFVIYGEDGAQGPADDYGLLPSGEPMVRAVPPFQSIVAGGINHFVRLSGDDPRDGVHWGLVAGEYDFANPFNLADLGWAVFGEDGLLYFREFQVRWRAKGTDDPWITLRNMPSWTTTLAASRPSTGFRLEDDSTYFIQSSALYLGSFDPDEIPETDQEIELQVIAVRVTEQTPLFWDGGTLGDLLQEIAAGLHTEEVPRERYDPVALAAFAASSPPARFILREPVTDRRTWVQENIYKPALVAPTFGTDREIVPLKWQIPNVSDPIPLLLFAQPIGEWQLPMGEAIKDVEVSYYREHLEPRKTIVTKDSPSWWKFWEGDRTVTIDDPEDTRRDWERLVETKVTVTNTNPDAPPGGKRLTYDPITIRSIANVDGAPVGGDTQSELGQQIADDIFETVLFHNRLPRPRMLVEVVATDANLERLAGDFVRARLPWLPDITTRLREMRQVCRIKAITESDDPSKLIFTLEYTGVADTTPEDDETGTGTGGEDCLTGGTLYPAAGGLAVRQFTAPGRYELENTCDHAVTIDELVVIAGGGGGGATATGGGGGAGGLVIAQDVVIGAGMVVPLDVGAGGAPSDNGDDSVLWLDRVTGLPLDPDVDDPDDGYRAIGGGAGGGGGVDGATGGSGGGGGATRPISGGASTTGGAGTSGQGNAGGGGEDGGGLATCQRSAGGGGGSFAGAGTAGDTNFSGGSSIAGVGGPSYPIPGWGIVAGGGGGGGLDDEPQGLGDQCSNLTQPGSAGSGRGAGGGGAANGGGESPGAPGIVAVRYSGPAAQLQPPTISSVEVNDEGRAEICIDAADWPGGVPDGYQARIEYAIGDYEPDPSSGDWRFLDMLDAPGCLLTPPVPTGAKVWARARAQADSYKFSEYSAGTDADAASTPGFASVELFVASDGTATLSWVPLATTGAVRIRRKIHLEGEAITRPLTLVASLDDSATPYVFADLVPEGSIITVDLEAWEDNTYTVQGRIERRSENNPERRFVERTDGLDALSDVELANVQEHDLLIADDYATFRNRARDLVLQEAAQSLSNDPDEYLNGEGDFVPLPNLSGWTEIVAAVDEDVTNSGALQDDDELFFPVNAGETYHVELLLVFSGSDNAVDMTTQWSFPSSDGFLASENKGTSGVASQGFQVFGPTATGTASTVALGTEASHALCVAWQRMMISCKASGNVRFRHANNSAAPGRVSRRKAGSVLRYRRLT